MSNTNHERTKNLKILLRKVEKAMSKDSSGGFSGTGGGLTRENVRDYIKNGAKLIRKKK
ncbi:MAG: hypothetical protein NC078_12460 [Ruminococcus sp.]|nr:hypothetical protein [Ruminococcus sp.]